MGGGGAEAGPRCSELDAFFDVTARGTTDAKKVVTETSLGLIKHSQRCLSSSFRKLRVVGQREGEFTPNRSTSKKSISP